MTRDSNLRIAVGVYVVRAPMGGLSWHYLQYVLGLARLGHDVLAVEVSDDHEWCCYNPALETNDTNPAFGLAYAQSAYGRLGLADRWAYHDGFGDGWCGPAAGTVMSFLRDADLFINISGATTMRPWFREVPRRVLIDTDPAFRQVRHLTVAEDRAVADAHNSFFTFGELFGREDCLIPDDGYGWIPTRQPVVLEEWRVTPVPANAPFTTVMRWDSYRPRRYQDLELGMKSRSFAPYRRLPSAAPAPLEMAIGAPCPHDELEAEGWRLQNPYHAAPDPWALQDFMAGSVGEFTVAKHGYVTTRSGWFSERSAGYLASGRPVITQDTGFGDILPTGNGLHSFHDPATAITAMNDVLSNPAAQGLAAREIAEEYFDSTTVLTRLIQQAMDE